MLNLYRKTEKTFENKQGSIYLTECPFNKPCLLCVSAQDAVKSVFGITKIGMRMARLRTRNNPAAMYDVKNFPVDFLAIRNEINLNTDSDEFVDRYVSEILLGNREDVKRKLRNINIIAYCDGVVRVKKILNSIEKKLIENGFNNVEELMSQICVITLSTEIDLNDIKATVIDFHDINDTEAIINDNNIDDKDVERTKNEGELLTVKPGKATYLFNGKAYHQLSQYFSDCKALPASVSKIVSNILKSSIEGKEMNIDLACNGVNELISLKDVLSQDELMSKVDSEIVYDGSSKLSLRECEMMDSMDDLLTSQFEMERKINRLTEEKEKLISRKEKMLETARESCSEPTYLRLLAASGWQLSLNDLNIIENNPTDKELLENRNEEIKVR